MRPSPFPLRRLFFLVLVCLLAAPSAVPALASGSRLADLEREKHGLDMELIRTRREEDPLGWAGLHYNLGRVLWDMGELRGGDAALFAQSAQSYEQALTVLTREAEAEKWASTWNALAGVCRAWGQSARDADVLERAVEGYRIALTYWVPEQCLKCWAMTRYNLGSTLLLIGNWEMSPVHWLGAAEEFYLVLGVRSRTTAQVDWPLLQYRLAMSLFMLGRETGGVRELDEARTAARGALAETSREREPDRYRIFADLASEVEAAIEARSGAGNRSGASPEISLRKSAEVLKRAEGARMRALRKKDERIMRESLDLYVCAADLIPRMERPLEWSAAEFALGRAWAEYAGLLEEIGAGPAGIGQALENAVAAFHSAAQTLSPGENPGEWGVVYFSLGNALLKLDAASPSNEALEEAAGSFQRALSTEGGKAAGERRAESWMLLGLSLERLGRRTLDRDVLLRAIAAYDEALRLWTRESSPDRWQEVRERRRAVRDVLAELPKSE